MSAPSKWAVVLATGAGALMLGTCIPLSEIIFTRAMEHGSMLACLVLLVMLGGSGLGLLLWGWHMARERQCRL